MTFDGGGGSSGTYWYGVNIEDMWRWVNRDLSPHYEQASSWKKTSELTGLYYQRLQAFHDKLAVAWNPKTSPAAEAYLTKLEELIKAVQDVNDVSARNYQSSVDIPNAIFEAKTKLEPIYRAYKQAQSDYSRSTTPTTTTTTTTTPTPTPSPGPSPTPSGANAAQTMNTKFDQAVGVMYKLSADLSRAQSGLGKPAPYLPPQSHLDDGSDYSGGGGAPMPPFIPAVVPSPPPPGPGGPTSPMPAPKGPDLSGLQPAPPTPGPTPGSPYTPGPYTPGPMPTGPIAPGPVGPVPSGYPPGGVIQPSIPGGMRPGGQLGNGPVRGVPGGVIGQVPPPRGTPGGARPNPVGGMIGGGAATGGRGGAAGPGNRGNGRGMMGALGVGGHAGRHDEEDSEHFDPDTLWDVAQGVAPVLDSPESQGPIDPGPAIGLSR
jgi:hypothetical protein